MDFLRRLIGLEYVRVITRVQRERKGYWRAASWHHEWLRVRPWWAVWRRWAP
jgi:hypothetical protein